MKERAGWLSKLGLLAGTLALIAAGDRLLLAKLGVTPWIPDPKLHFRLRPNYQYWFGGKLVRINSHGFHDDEFPTDKPAGELRLVCLGDSVTMGHGVTREETYVNQLERLLAQAGLGYRSVQAINTGVQGYSTGQELEMLRQSLVFSPDVVTIGFVMNDITEPFIVSREAGGTGLDYHEVLESSSLLAGWLLNETGYGRLAVHLRFRHLERDVRFAKLIEANDVRRMVAERLFETDSRLRSGFESCLRDLAAVYRIARDRRIGVALLVFPNTFQLGDPRMHGPQARLVEHARAHGVPVLDLTEVFEKELAGGGRVETYFLDDDHLTPRGHTVVARHLLSFLREERLLPPPGQLAR